MRLLPNSTDKTSASSVNAQPGGVLNSATVETRWDEKAGLRRDAVRSQVIDALEAQEIKETGNEEKKEPVGLLCAGILQFCYSAGRLTNSQSRSRSAASASMAARY